MNIGIIRKKTYSRMIWDYNHADFDSFRSKLQDFNWDNCFLFNSIDQIAQAWTTSFLNIARECIPNKIVKIYPNDKPFYNSELRKQKRKCTRARRTAMRLKTERLWENYRQLRNNYNRAIEEAKMEHDLNLRKYLYDNQGNLSQKKWWKITKDFLGQNKCSSYPPLNIQGKIIVTNKDKADAFNNFFISHSEIDTSEATIPVANAIPGDSLNSFEFTLEDITDLLKSLDTTKSSGPDIISAKMLREAGYSIAPSLYRLFQLSLDLCLFPNDWKKANGMGAASAENGLLRSPLLLFTFPASVCLRSFLDKIGKIRIIIFLFTFSSSDFCHIHLKVE